jgi:hypothetical protein
MGRQSNDQTSLPMGTTTTDAQPARNSQALVEFNPTPKIALLLRYRIGKKSETIDHLFEQYGDGSGVILKVQQIGHSRRYLTPAEFPDGNIWVGGHEHEGMMFLKWQLID